MKFHCHSVDFVIMMLNLFWLNISSYCMISSYLQISWEAKLRETSDKTEDVMLTSQLVKTAGTAMCPGRQEFCPLEISLVNDQVGLLGFQIWPAVSCTIKFLNFWTLENFAVIYLKLKQRGQTEYFVKKVHWNSKQ